MSERYPNLKGSTWAMILSYPCAKLNVDYLINPGKTECLITEVRSKNDE